MTAAEAHPGESWIRLATPHGRYEYQFQGRTPTVRGGRYEDSTDYQFLLLDTDGWLFRIPIRVAADAEAALRKSPGTESGEFSEVIRVAAGQLRAGLQKFQPRPNVPFEELDMVFALDLRRTCELRDADREPA
jgi:hypothetical protein